jgi:predicted NBD/HSP70 family sugar kinase
MSAVERERPPRPVAVLNKASNRDARRRNLEAALQSVYREGVTSRADIARLTGLTRATVSDLVSELVRDDLVREAGPGTSSGGKPPTLLTPNPGGRDILAIDLGRQPFQGALVDLGGQIHHRLEGSPDPVAGPAATEEVSRLARRLVRSSDAPVLGIGVGTPGIVDPGGSVVEAANLDWHGVPLGQELIDRLGLPVVVANDAHAAALAEFDPGLEANLALVKVGIGVGAGLMVDGRLYGGDRPAAGEIGHIRVVDDGAPCTCGNTGCLETVVSVPAILRAARTASNARVPATGDPMPWDAVELAAILGPEAVRTAVERAGHALGSVLAHLVAILDVHRIVVALELRGAAEDFLRAAREEVVARVLPDLATVVELSPAARDEDLVLAGAAALVLRDRLGVAWR